MDELTNFFVFWILHLELRLKDGERFTLDSPLFGVRSGGVTAFLDYKIMTSYDTARCAALGATQGLKIKGQSRRKGGASSAKDAGLKLDDIRTLGRWSLGVLDAYIKPRNTWRYALHQEIARNVIKNRNTNTLPAAFSF